MQLKTDSLWPGSSLCGHVEDKDGFLSDDGPNLTTLLVHRGVLARFHQI